MEEEETNPHSLALECLCRVCGKRACPSKRQRSVYKCANYITDLQTTFGIKTSDDDPLIHPVNFCHGCKGTVYNFKNGKSVHPLSSSLTGNHTKSMSVQHVLMQKRYVREGGQRN